MPALGIKGATISTVIGQFICYYYSLIVNMSRQLIFSLPLILILKNIFGINGIWTSFVLAEFITMIIAIILHKRNKRLVINKISMDN